jgi:HAD superfamily hydrolase (TIGR01509 family)
MILRPATCFLFDFDGTLVDSSRLHERAFRRVLAEHATERLARFDYDSVKGKPTRDALIAIGVSEPEKLERLTVEKQRHYRAAVSRKELRPIADADGLLGDLRDAGHRLFLVTSGSRESVAMALAATRLEGFFVGVVTSDDIEHAKPSPDAFLSCLARFSLPADRSVVVEDAPSGVAAGRAARLPVIGVNNPAVSRLSDVYFETLGEMRRWVRSQATERAIIL